ncbi:MAG: trehalase-like domain-containing protein, partial [Acidimicrobiia bacterium]
MRYPAISDYALIGDCHSAALVSRAGSVDWCCFHRFDARPVFGRVLDWDRGGFFQISPRRLERTARRYLPGTNVLESRYETSSGALSVIDCMPVQGRGEDPPAATQPHPHHQLLRMLRCEGGEVDVGIELRPRFDYGRTVPRME